MDKIHDVVLLKANTETIHLDGLVITRDKKGFYDGTAICKKTNKKNKNMWDFLRLPSTVTRLSLMGGREANVYKAVVEGVKTEMVSPTIFLHLVQWLDPKLDLIVSAWLMNNSSLNTKQVQVDLNKAREEVNKRDTTINRLTNELQETKLLEFELGITRERLGRVMKESDDKLQQVEVLHQQQLFDKDTEFIEKISTTHTLLTEERELRITEQKCREKEQQERDKAEAEKQSVIETFNECTNIHQLLIYKFQSSKCENETLREKLTVASIIPSAVEDEYVKELTVLEDKQKLLISECDIEIKSKVATARLEKKKKFKQLRRIENKIKDIEIDCAEDCYFIQSQTDRDTDDNQVKINKIRDAYMKRKYAELDAKVENALNKNKKIK
jgi:hypothetical protein